MLGAILLGLVSEENVDIVRACFTAYEQGDFRYGIEHGILDRAIEYSEAHEESGGPTYRGLESLEEGFADFLRSWEDYRCAAAELIDAGDKVVISGRQWGVERDGGKRVESPFFQVWTLRDGRVVGIRNFASRDAALDAAAVDE